MPRFGSVALAGYPNAGKSSLLNAILDAHVALVSAKAQATRLPVQGIYTNRNVQIEFIDLPGLLEPAYLLQKRMRQLALDALARVDLVLHLHPANEAPAPPFATLVADGSPVRAPVQLVYTKGDLVTAEAANALARKAIVTSVRDKGSVARLLDAIGQRMPERPFRHVEDDIAVQPIRFFVAEFLREAVFEQLRDEVPYAVAVEVDEFRENQAPVYIRATLFVERDSQKGIVIGKGGATLRELGAHARQRIEALIGAQVFLDTRVKVLPRWRRNASALTRFGFPIETVR